MKPRKVRGRSTSPEGEQCSIRLWMKALYVVRSSGVPKKDVLGWGGLMVGRLLVYWILISVH